MRWEKMPVLVTGGASFIGSHLVDALLKKGAMVRVVDNFSSGRRENLREAMNTGRVEIVERDLLEPGAAAESVRGMRVVFHLAADHGGRGYVDLHQAECSTNLIMDGLMIRESLRAGVEKFIFASSGCVYPNYIQTDPSRELYLTEDKVGPPFDADNLYGWAKLMGEMTLKAYYERYGMKSVSCRYFTVYGPRGVENHAVIAMIARAFIGEDPFEVWGTGEQVRNWTYVDDIVEGTLLAAEKIEDATAVNLGTMERTRVVDAVKMVLEYTGHKASLRFRPEMPTGPYNRVADNRLASKLLGWQPKVMFREGLLRTIDWYFSHKNKEEVKAILGTMLTERAGDSNAVSRESCTRRN